MSPKASRTVLIAGVVVVVVSVMAAVTVLAIVGDGLTAGAKTIIINQLIISIPTLIAGIAALAAKQKVDEVHHDLQNGLIPAKVKETINEMASDPAQSSVTINSDEAANEFDSEDRSAAGNGGWSTKIVKDQ